MKHSLYAKQSRLGKKIYQYIISEIRNQSRLRKHIIKQENMNRLRRVLTDEEESFVTELKNLTKNAFSLGQTKLKQNKCI